MLFRNMSRMTAEQIGVTSISPEKNADKEKRTFFEVQLQAYYHLKKSKVEPEAVVCGSSEQKRIMKRMGHQLLGDAFRKWFEELEASGDQLIPNYLASHTEDDIANMKDMDEILAVLETTRHRRTLH